MGSDLDRTLERVGERLRNPTIVPPEDLPVRRRPTWWRRLLARWRSLWR